MDITVLQGQVPDIIYQQIQLVIDKFQINTSARLSHFLGQCAHESGGFTALTENLNYSAQGLNAVFGAYFPNGLADQYARNPQKIGSRVYSNRNGNGDEVSGEGYTYRGRGAIQLT